MKLVDLLASVETDTLELLSERHLGVRDNESRAAMCVSLESELRSPKRIRDSIFNLQPPSFRILELLLDSSDRSIPIAGLRERAMEDTLLLASRVSEGAIASSEALTLYRHVLCEARRSDLELDPSETALLWVLRRELKIRQVEHFLTEHHEELQQFWNTEHAFLEAVNGLRDAGLAFGIDGSLVFPEDLVQLTRQVLGLEMSSDARRRLLSRLSGQAMSSALQAWTLKGSGTKEEKLQRLLDNYVPPSEILGEHSGSDLRELCRELGVVTSGAKEDLVDRVVKHFAGERDLIPEPEEIIAPPEARLLASDGFDRLFGLLRQQDLSDILAGIGSSRVTGSKEHLLRLVRESPFAEPTLLSELDLRQLEAALEKARLKTGGSKTERVKRLIEFAEGPASAEFAR